MTETEVNPNDPTKTVDRETLDSFKQFQEAEPRRQSAYALTAGNIEIGTRRAEYVTWLKGILPEMEQKNDNWLFHEVRSNRGVQETLVSKILERKSQIDPAFAALLENSDEEGLAKIRRQTHNELNTSVNQVMYDGKTAREALSNHLAEYSRRNRIPVAGDYTRLIDKNAEHYERFFGEIDSRTGRLGTPPDVVRAMVMADDDLGEELRGQLIEDKFKDFDNELSKRHNGSIFNIEQEPKEYAKAFHIFNRNGAEALTDYINILTHYNENIPVQYQDPRVIRAFNNMKTGATGENPFVAGANFIGGNPNLPTEMKFREWISESARNHEVDPFIIAGIINNESRFNENVADGGVGEIGLGQIDPTQAGIDLGMTAEQLRDPRKNIEGTTRYFKQLLDWADGNVEHALAAYNWGMGNMDRNDRDYNVAPKVAEYVNNALNFAQQASDGAEMSDPLVFTEMAELPKLPHDWNTLQDVWYQTIESDAGVGIYHGPTQTASYLTNLAAALDLPLPIAEGMEILIDSDKPDEVFDYMRNAWLAGNIKRELPVEAALPTPSNALRYLLSKIPTVGTMNPTLRSLSMLNLLGKSTTATQQEAKVEVGTAEVFPYKNYQDFLYMVGSRIGDMPGGVEQAMMIVGANGTPTKWSELVEKIPSLEGFYNDQYDDHTIWHIDLREVPLSVQVVSDAMLQHSLGNYFMQKYGHHVVMEPSKQDRLDAYRSSIHFSKQRPVLDPVGQLVGIETYNPNNIPNFIAGAFWGITDIGQEAISGVYRWNADRMEDLQKLGMDGVGVEHKIERMRARQYRTAGHYGGMTNSDDMMFGMGASEFGSFGGMLGGYMLTAGRLGYVAAPAALRGLEGASIWSINQYRKLSNARTLYHTSNASHVARNRAMLDNGYIQGLRNWRRSTSLPPRGADGRRLPGVPYGTPLRFTAGSALIETWTDPNYSVTLMADEIIQKHLMGLEGDDLLYDFQRMYRTSNAFGRWMTDWLGAEALGVLFDGMLGQAKFFKDYTLRKPFGRQLPGIEFDGTTGRYKEVPNTYMPFPDIQRFLYNVNRNGAAVNAIGDYKQALARASKNHLRDAFDYEPGEEPTRHDLAVYFVDQSEPFMQGLRHDIYNTVKDTYGRYYKGTQPTEAELWEQADKIYSGFINDLAGDINRVIDQTSGGALDWDARAFADMLDNYPGRITEENILKTTGGKDVMSNAEANVLLHRNPTAKKIKISDSEYMVIKPDKLDEWVHHLAYAMRVADDGSSFDSIIKKHYAKYGIDPSNVSHESSAQWINELLEEWHGKAVGTGTIEGFDSGGWIVKRPDGTSVRYQKIRFEDGTVLETPLITKQGETTDANIRERQTTTTTGRTGDDTPATEGGQLRTDADTGRGVEGEQEFRSREGGSEGSTRSVETPEAEPVRTSKPTTVEGDVVLAEGDIVRLPDLFGGADARVRGLYRHADGTEWADVHYVDSQGRLSRLYVPTTDLQMVAEGSARTLDLRALGNVEWESLTDVMAEFGRVITGTGDDFTTILRNMEEVFRASRTEMTASSRSFMDDLMFRTMENVARNSQDPTIREYLLRELRELQQRGAVDEALDMMRNDAGAIELGRPAGDAVDMAEQTLREIDQTRTLVRGAREAHDLRVEESKRTPFHEAAESHMVSLQQALETGDVDRAAGEIQTMRQLGADVEQIDQMIRENWKSGVGENIDHNFIFLQKLNKEFDGDFKGDEWIRQRIMEARKQAHRNWLADQIRRSRAEGDTKRADELVAMQHKVEKPLQAVPKDVTPGVLSKVNRLFRLFRPKAEGESPQAYARRLAVELGTDGMSSIGMLAKVFKTTSKKTGATISKRTPIVEWKADAPVDKNGRYTSAGRHLVVKVTTSDGQMPDYAMSLVPKITDSPSRWVLTEEGGYMRNPQWAFVSKNETTQVDGTLKKFTYQELDNGDMSLVEDIGGTHVLNVQKTREIPWRVFNSQDSDRMLNATAILRNNVDGVRSVDPQGRTHYRLVSDEQIKKIGEVYDGTGVEKPRPTTPPDDTANFSWKRVLASMSHDGDSIIPIHAWLAVPGLTLTGSIGMDEDGNLTPFGYAAMALGMMGAGGVMVRSMTSKFKVRASYDRLSPDQKQVFDRINWMNYPKHLSKEQTKVLKFMRRSGTPDVDFDGLKELQRNFGQRMVGDTSISAIAKRNTDDHLAKVQLADELPNTIKPAINETELKGLINPEDVGMYNTGSNNKSIGKFLKDTLGDDVLLEEFHGRDSIKVTKEGGEKMVALLNEAMDSVRRNVRKLDEELASKRGTQPALDIDEIFSTNIDIEDGFNSMANFTDIFFDNNVVYVNNRFDFLGTESVRDVNIGGGREYFNMGDTRTYYEAVDGIFDRVNLLKHKLIAYNDHIPGSAMDEFIPDDYKFTGEFNVELRSGENAGDVYGRPKRPHFDAEYSVSRDAEGKIFMTLQDEVDYRQYGGGTTGMRRFQSVIDEVAAERKESGEAKYTTDLLAVDPNHGIVVNRRIRGHMVPEGYGKGHGWIRSTELKGLGDVIDEIQLENALQRGDEAWGAFGNLKDDMFAIMLDNYIGNILKAGKDTFYIVRGEIVAGRWDSDFATSDVRQSVELGSHPVKRMQAMQTYQTDTISSFRQLLDELGGEQNIAVSVDTHVALAMRRGDHQPLDAYMNHVERVFKSYREVRPEVIPDVDRAVKVFNDNYLTTRLGEHNLDDPFGFYLHGAENMDYSARFYLKNAIEEGRVNLSDERFSQIRGLTQAYNEKFVRMIEKRYGTRVQMADPEARFKRVFDSPEEAFHKVTISPENFAKSQGKSTKRLDFEMVPKSVLGAGLLLGVGAGLHHISDIEPDPEFDQAGMSTWAMAAIVLGGAAMIGSRRARYRVGRGVKSQVKAARAHYEGKLTAKTIEIDGVKHSIRDLNEKGIPYDAKDDKSIRRAQLMVKALHGAVEAGKAVRDGIKTSRHTQAGSQLLRSLADTIRITKKNRAENSADRLYDFLVGPGRKAAMMKGIPATEFNAKYTDKPQAFQRYRREEGVGIIRDIVGNPDLNEASAIQMFDDALWRLRNRGLRRYRDTAVVDGGIPDKVKVMYNDPEFGATYQKMDEQLFRNDKFVDYATAYERGYRQFEDEYFGILDRTLLGVRNVLDRTQFEAGVYRGKDGQAVDHKHIMALIDRFIGYDPNYNAIMKLPAVSYRTFVSGLSPNDRHIMRKLKASHNKGFKEILEHQTRKAKYTNVGPERYHPQMFDYDALSSVRQNHIDNAKNRTDRFEEDLANKDNGYSQDISPEDYAYREMMKEFMKTNQGKFNMRSLLGFDPDVGVFEPKTFKNQDGAVEAMLGILNRKTVGQDIIDEFYREMGGDITAKNLMNRGFIQEVVGLQGEVRYILAQPEGFNLRVNDTDHNIFHLENMYQSKNWYDSVMLGPTVKRSRFLENPRQYDIPFNWALRDSERAWEAYANDAGYRLHAMQNGVFKGEDFTTKFVSPLRRELAETGVSDVRLGEIEGRVQQMFNMQWGIISELDGMSSIAEKRDWLNRRRAVHNWLGILRNLAQFKHAHGFKYLNFHQVGMSTYPMTSRDAYKAVHGFGDQAFSYEGMKAMENFMTDAHVVNHKNKAFRVDITDMDIVGEGNNSISGWLYKQSMKLADFSNDFEFTKTLFQLDPDVAGSRGFRMVTDSFQGTNMMNNSLNSAAFLHELAYVTRVAKRMMDSGGIVRGDDGVLQAVKNYTDPDTGRTFNLSELEDSMRNLGINPFKEITMRDPDTGAVTTRTQFEYITAKEVEFNDWVDGMRNGERVDLNSFEPEHADILHNMIHHATESYNGTNMLNRPESWNSAGGRTLAMFAGFTFNIGMQVTKRRILDPINNWGRKFDPEGQIGKMQMATLMDAARKGDYGVFARAGVTNPQQAMAEFPFGAVETAWRALGGIGFSLATYATLDIIRDIYAYPVNEVTGEPQFQNIKNLSNITLNPHDQRQNHVSMMSLFGGYDEREDENAAKDFMRVLAWTGGVLSRSSYLGMYPSPFDSISRYGFRGTEGVFPTAGIFTRMVSDGVGVASAVGNLDVGELGQASSMFLLNNNPITGVNAARDMRRSMRSSISRVRKTGNFNDFQNPNPADDEFFNWFDYNWD